MKKTGYTSILILLVLIVLLLVIITSIIRQYDTYIFTRDAIADFDQNKVSLWINSLESGDVKQGLNLASKMVIKSNPYVPFPYYLEKAQECDINSNFFNPPFNILDFLYWKNCYELKKIVNNTKTDSKNNNIVEKLFNLVYKNIKLIDSKKINFKPSFTIQVWNKKQGTLIDKYLLLSDLIQQAQYGIQIVVLLSRENSKPVHIVAEITNTNGSSTYTCDLVTGSFWDMSVEELKQNKNLLIKVWNNRSIKGLNYLLYKTEISAMSYRKINQQLGKYLANGPKELPIIGIDPIKVIKKNRTEISKINNNSLTVLGVEPFTIIKNSKFFSKKWLTLNKK